MCALLPFHSVECVRDAVCRACVNVFVNVCAHAYQSACLVVPEGSRESEKYHVPFSAKRSFVLVKRMRNTNELNKHMFRASQKWGRPFSVTPWVREHASLRRPRNYWHLMQSTRSMRSTVCPCATAAIVGAGALRLSGPRMPPRTGRRAQRTPPTAEQRWLLVVSRINILRRMRQEWSSVGMFLNWWRNEHLRGRRRALPNQIVQPLGWEVLDLAAETGDAADPPGP